MNLQLTAPTEWGFPRLRIVLTALICGMVFMATAAPESVFAQAAATTDEDTPTNFTVSVPTGYELRYIFNSASPAGSLGSVSGSTVFYTPAPDFFGTGQVQYALCETGTTNCNPSVTAQITVNPVNDDPIANDDPMVANEAAYEMYEGATNLTVPAGVGLLANDSDIDNPTGLSAALDVAPTYGSVVVNTNGSFVYTPPDPFFHGMDTFTYMVTDGAGGDDTAMATVTVLPILSPVLLEIPTTFTETLVLTPTSTLITVPVHFDDRYEEIVGLNFGIEYDTSCLSYDSFNEVATQAATADIGASDAPSTTVGSNVLTFAILDVPPGPSDPFTPLADGHILDVLFTYNPACGSNPLTSSQLHFEDVVPTVIYNGNVVTAGATTPNAHSFDVIQNSAPEDISRYLVNPSSPGSGKLSEGPVNGTHFATLTTKEQTAGDPEYDASNNATDHIYAESDTGCNGAANDNAEVDLQGARGQEVHFLTANKVIDFETQSQWRICVTSTDPHGASFEKRIFISIQDMDEAPTDILIDDANDTPDAGAEPAPGPASINEGANANAPVGTLSVDEMDVNDILVNNTGPISHTYEILSVTSMTGTVPTTTFAIAMNQLQVGPNGLDHEKSDSYDIVVRAFDAYSQITMTAYTTPTLYVDATITVNITDVNEMPGGVTPTAFSVSESTAVGTSLVPALTTFGDPDADEMHSYSFVNGGSSPAATCAAAPYDHGRFSIDTATGVIKTDGFMFATGSNSGPYRLCVRTTDKGGLSKDTLVTVNVTDNNLPPVAVNDTLSPSDWVVVGNDLYSVDSGDGSLTYYGPADIDVLANDFDPNNDVIVVNFPHGPSNSYASTADGTVERQGDHIKYSAPTPIIITPTPVPTAPPLTTPTPPPFAGTDSFTYDIRDNQGPPNNISAPATVELTYIMAHDKADCNADGAVNSNDFIMNVLEMFEFVGIEWYEIHEHGLVGSPWGCNSQQDSVINILDVICTVNTFFGNSCDGTVQASNVRSQATLAIGDNLEAAAGETIQVPVILDNSGDNVAGAGFFIDIGDSLQFDDTDANGDGLPDAVNLNLSASSQAMIDYDAEAGLLKFAMFGQSLPMSTLADGTIATITLQVKADATGDQADVAFADGTSLSDPNAVAVPVATTDSTITIVNADGSSSIEVELFLPISIH